MDYKAHGSQILLQSLAHKEGPIQFFFFLFPLLPTGISGENNTTVKSDSFSESAQRGLIS